MQPSGGRDRRGERGNHKTTIQRSYVSSFFDGGLLVLGGFTANYLETCTQVSLHESNTLHSIYEVVGLSRCLEESSTFKTMLFHDDKFAVKVMTGARELLEQRRGRPKKDASNVG